MAWRQFLAQKRNANFGYGSVRIFGPEFGQGRFQEKFETIQLLRDSHKIKFLYSTGNMILRLRRRNHAIKYGPYDMAHTFRGLSYNMGHTV